MLNPDQVPHAVSAPQRPWDARLAHRLVIPLKDSWVTPNHLTTLRLALGFAGAAALSQGTYGWSNAGALLLILSNFLDHTDGELARISGKTSRIGHLYDLASDAAVTILLFIAMGAAVTGSAALGTEFPPVLSGAIAGSAIAVIFFLRMRIEEILGKAATQQASLAGFETEDVIYLLPFITLCNAVGPALLVASTCAPLFAVWVAIDYRGVMRQERSGGSGVTG
jgi:archaetidylinositol phosphate synthase